MSLLSVEDLRVSYDNIQALHGLSFAIDEGEIVCIIGANGAGKSTTLRAISRMVRVQAGTRMTLQGRDLLGYSADRVVSELGVSHVPEGRRLFENLTVMENLKLATFARRDTAQVAVDLKRMLTLFPRLDERRVQKAGTMSGGEQQMLAVARAYMSGRRMMLLDEPLDGARPAADDEHVPGPQGDQPRGHHDPAGRAERAPGAAVRPARLRHRERQTRAGRALEGPAGERRSAEGVSGGVSEGQ